MPSWEQYLKFKDNSDDFDSQKPSDFAIDAGLAGQFLGITLSRKEYDTYHNNDEYYNTGKTLTAHINLEIQAAIDVGHKLTTDEIMLRMLHYCERRRVHFQEDDNYPVLLGRLEKYMKQRIIEDKWEYPKDAKKNSNVNSVTNKNRPPASYMKDLEALEDHIYHGVKDYYQNEAKYFPGGQPDEELVNEFILQAHVDQHPRWKIYDATPAELPDSEPAILLLLQEKHGLVEGQKALPEAAVPNRLLEASSPRPFEIRVKQPYTIDLRKYPK